MKYMSVITNFGCHYKCPYCIVKENNLHIPKTTLAGLDSFMIATELYIMRILLSSFRTFAELEMKLFGRCL